MDGYSNGVCFRDGENAYYRGKDISECPYESCCDARVEWRDGWTAAAEDSTKI